MKNNGFKIKQWNLQFSTLKVFFFLKTILIYYSLVLLISNFTFIYSLNSYFISFGICRVLFVFGWLIVCLWNGFEWLSWVELRDTLSYVIIVQKLKSCLYKWRRNFVCERLCCDTSITSVFLFFFLILSDVGLPSSTIDDVGESEWF